MSRHVTKLALAAALALLAGCVSPTAEVQNTEQMLAASGFAQQPAVTPAQNNQLLLMPSHQLIAKELPDHRGLGYVYADPDLCHCVWKGNAQNYQAFEQLAFQQHLADEQVQAAEIASEPFDWGPWGGPWGPPVVVEHEHGRR